MRKAWQLHDRCAADRKRSLTIDISGRIATVTANVVGKGMRIFTLDRMLDNRWSIASLSEFVGK